MTSYISLPSYLNTIDQRYRLIGKKCKSCGTVNFPPRVMCIECGGRDFEDIKLSGRGKIHAFTIISRGSAPSEFDDQQNMTGEFGVAVIELEEGPRIIGQLTDCDPNPEKIRIGTEVRATVRKLYEQEGVIRYGYKFTPV
ncbi:MAG: Zn-ribbon domain-containing OB-fold protein [bacterium]